jgi:hypothetical protein
MCWNPSNLLLQLRFPLRMTDLCLLRSMLCICSNSTSTCLIIPVPFSLSLKLLIHYLFIFISLIVHHQRWQWQATRGKRWVEAEVYLRHLFCVAAAGVITLCSSQTHPHEHIHRCTSTRQKQHREWPGESCRPWSCIDGMLMVTLKTVAIHDNRHSQTA